MYPSYDGIMTEVTDWWVAGEADKEICVHAKSSQIFVTISIAVSVVTWIGLTRSAGEKIKPVSNPYFIAL